jgi:hypothetical protein
MFDFSPIPSISELERSFGNMTNEKLDWIKSVLVSCSEGCVPNDKDMAFTLQFIDDIQNDFDNINSELLAVETELLQTVEELIGEIKGRVTDEQPV